MKKKSTTERDGELENTNFTNLTSLSTTTRLFTEEVRNIYNIMERRFRLADERYERFQER